MIISLGAFQSLKRTIKMIKIVGSKDIRLFKDEQKALDSAAMKNDMLTTKVTNDDSLIEANVSAMSDTAVEWIINKLKIKEVD